MQLRLIGIKDGMGYRHYSGNTNGEIVEQFFVKELTNATRGDWFYAHAGGLADVQFMLEWLIDRPEYEVSASFSGASAIIVRIKRGSCTWYLVDSLWTLRASVRELGDRLGFPKGEVEWDAPLDQLIPYNERDCDILWRSICEFEKALIALGSELRMTLAGCAMRLIGRRYLKKPIKNSQQINRKLRPAYVGGRVEVFFNKPHSGYYYDINSCYPFAMTMPLPRRLLRSLNRLPKEGSEVCYFADLTITIPEINLPTVPFMYDDSLFFATGKRRQWLCGPEIERSLECGAQIEKVHECLVYERFTDLKDFALEIYKKRLIEKTICACGHKKADHKRILATEIDPISSLPIIESYACERCECIEFLGGYMELVLKLLLNSGYGKFGERPDKVALLVNPSKEKLEELIELHRRSLEALKRGTRDRPLRQPSRYEKGVMHMFTPGAFIIEKETKVPNAHVPIAAYVTSYARVLLHKHLNASKGEIYYCDTDGFATNDPNVPTGNELGELKLEKKYFDALFHAPKLYMIEAAGGSEIVQIEGKQYLLTKDAKQIVRAKGFHGVCNCLRPLPKRLGQKCEACGLGRGDHFGREGFEKLIAGEGAVIGRMLRIRELYGKGETRPRELSGDDAEQKFALGGNPKRCFSEDGRSRPWTIGELEKNDHRRAGERRKPERRKKIK